MNGPSVNSGRTGKNLGRLEHPLQPCPEQMLWATLFMIGHSATLREKGNKTGGSRGEFPLAGLSDLSKQL